MKRTLVRRSVPLLLLPVAVTSLAFAESGEPLSAVQEPIEEMAEKAGIKLPGLPWHLANVWWNFTRKTEKFESFAVDITVDRDLPSEYNLYISPIGIGKLNNISFYGGLQTHITGWPSKEDHNKIAIGPGAIFSRWSIDEKTPIGLDEVRVANDGLCESAGYEGEFCSVRRPLVWGKGTYTWSIVKGDTEQVDGEDRTWFHCLVRTHSTNTMHWIGSLRFEGKDFTFWDKNAAFIEIYSSRAGGKNVPKVNITFGYPRINGEAIPLKNAYANYNVSTKSPACSKVRAEGSDVVIETGALFERSDDALSEPLNLTMPK